MTAVETRAGELHVRLRLPYPRPPRGLAGNARVHWSVKARDTRQVRSDVVNLAKAAGLHRYQPGEVEHVTLQLVWAPGDRRRRDEDNLNPLVKVVADALARGPRADWVGLDVVPDDTPEYMTRHRPLILAPPAPAGMWVDLRLRFTDPDDEDQQ